MARRLVEQGVTYVEVALDGWDTHANNFDALSRRLLPELDKGMGSLVADLAARAAARHHDDRLDGRVRPHAPDQPERRPRPLAAELVGRRGRRRHEEWPGRRRDRQGRRRHRRPPGRRDGPGRHDDQGDGHQRRARSTRRRAAGRSRSSTAASRSRSCSAERPSLGLTWFLEARWASPSTGVAAPGLDRRPARPQSGDAGEPTRPAADVATGRVGPAPRIGSRPVGRRSGSNGDRSASDRGIGFESFRPAGVGRPGRPGRGGRPASPSGHPDRDSEWRPSRVPARPVAATGLGTGRLDN